MATPANQAKPNTRQATTRRNQPAKPVVPAASREATARKLEPEMVAPETVEELNFESDVVTQVVTGREAEARRQKRLQEITRLTEKRDEFVERLDTGAAKIEEARSQGKDVTLWEDYWIQLLRQYEKVCDNLRDLYVEA